MDLSVVILNYNVKSFLQQALRSTLAAMEGVEGEIYVVDNASTDGSVEMVREKFPEVHLIVHTENVGFARANNVAIRRCQGRYVLLLNPDTVVREDTLRTMIAFMDAHPEAGVAGCRVLNADGTLQLACRRGFPTPWVALSKILGLSSVFPKSRLFGGYNLTYLDPNVVSEVDALSGSFMMVRAETMRQVGGLDETFFMYGEDLDWCYRIKQEGWKIYYVPTTEIVHFQGESARLVSRVKNLIDFYRAMHIFVGKHLRKKYLWFPEWLLTAGIVLRGLFSVIVRMVQSLAIPMIDLILVVVGLSLGIFTRFGRFPYPLPPYRDERSYAIIYGACALLWLGGLYISGAYGRRKYSPLRALMGIFVGSLAINSVALFMKETYTFSRLVALYAPTYNAILVAGWRGIVTLISRARAGFRIGRRRTLIVGTGKEGRSFLHAVRDHAALGYDVVGFVGNNNELRGQSVDGVGVLGLVEDLPNLVREYNVDEIVVTTPAVSYSDILRVSSGIGRANVEFRLVPSSLEVLSEPERVSVLDDMPLIHMAYAPRRVWRRLVRWKRGRQKSSEMKG